MPTSPLMPLLQVRHGHNVKTYAAQRALASLEAVKAMAAGCSCPPSSVLLIQRPLQAYCHGWLHTAESEQTLLNLKHCELGREQMCANCTEHLPLSVTTSRFSKA